MLPSDPEDPAEQGRAESLAEQQYLVRGSLSRPQDPPETCPPAPRGKQGPNGFPVEQGSWPHRRRSNVAPTPVVPVRWSRTSLLHALISRQEGPLTLEA